MKARQRRSVCKLVRFVKLMGTCVAHTMRFINNRSPNSDESLVQNCTYECAIVNHGEIEFQYTIVL